jgi:hypothetical protein
MTEQTTSSSSNNSNSPRLQTVNYANVVAFFLNLIVTFGSSQFLPDNAELSAKYQTLITPAGYAFAIWGIIFTAELVWTIVQVLPSYRSDELIIKGVGYNFVWACLAQTAWSIIFGLEQIVLSLVAMVLILMPLVLAVTQTNRLGSSTPTIKYWLLIFPIQIHAAWIMAATLVNFNVVFVASNVSSTGQAMAGFVSLFVALCVGLYYTMKQTFVVPAVLSWATFAIASELQSPRESITATFSSETIEQARVASMVVASTVLALAIAKFLYDRIIGGGRSSSGTTSATAGDNNGNSSTDYSPIS